MTSGWATRKRFTSGAGTTTQRVGARARMSATAGSPSRAEISPKKLPRGEDGQLLAFEHDADLALDDHEQAQLVLAPANDPVALVEERLVGHRRERLELGLAEVGEEREAPERVEELRAGRVHGAYAPRAWMAVIATVLTMSVTVQPRLRSFTGLRSPCSTGPIATACAERCTAL